MAPGANNVSKDGWSSVSFGWSCGRWGLERLWFLSKYIWWVTTSVRSANLPSYPDRMAHRGTSRRHRNDHLRSGGAWHRPRVPNIDGLNLETAGVEYSRRGIKVSDAMRATNPAIFAAGDCADSGLNLTPVSAAEGRIAGRTFWAARTRGRSSIRRSRQCLHLPMVATVACRKRRQGAG